MPLRNLTRIKLSSLAVAIGLIWLCHLFCPQAAGREAGSTLFDDHYHHAWRLVCKNTLHESKLATLCEWEHKFDGRLDTQDAADNAIVRMVESLGDEYTFFRDREATARSNQQHEERGIVSAISLPENIAWIKMRTFGSEHAAEELREALLQADSADGYILDLRDNKGGDIYEAFAAAAMFIDKGAFTRLKGRLDGCPYNESMMITPTKLRFTVNELYWDEARSANLTAAKPLVVLVNKKTRSAAEMLAGALRDNRRCMIIGEQTYGKGVVQKIFPLSDGASLKIVIARYYLPSGQSVHGIGLRPNVLTKESDDQIEIARTVLRREVIARRHITDQLSMR